MPSGSPARASIQPSWPPPRTPTLTDAAERPEGRGDAGIRRVEDGARLPAPEALHGLAKPRMLRAQDGGGQERGVDRPGPADGERAHRDAGGHLDDREQRVQPVERARFHGHAEDGQRGLRRSHAGQVRRATRRGDDHTEAAARRGLRVLEEKVRGAVRRDDAHLVRNAQNLQGRDGVRHRLPVRPGAHDHTHKRARGWPRFFGIGTLRAVVYRGMGALLIVVAADDLGHDRGDDEARRRRIPHVAAHRGPPARRHCGAVPLARRALARPGPSGSEAGATGSDFWWRGSPWASTSPSTSGAWR